MNFETVLHYKRQDEAAARQPQQQQQPLGAPSLPEQLISSYAVPALKGFVRSITLSSKGNSLQGLDSVENVMLDSNLEHFNVIF